MKNTQELADKLEWISRKIPLDDEELDDLRDAAAKLRSLQAIVDSTTQSLESLPCYQTCECLTSTVDALAAQVQKGDDK